MAVKVSVDYLHLDGEKQLETHPQLRVESLTMAVKSMSCTLLGGVGVPHRFPQLLLKEKMALVAYLWLHTVHQLQCFLEWQPLLSVTHPLLTLGSALRTCFI